MTYYRVKPEYDNTRYTRTDKRTGRTTWGGFLIANELYTLRELERMAENGCKRLEPYKFEPVEISKRRVYWCFGARFAATPET